MSPSMLLRPGYFFTLMFSSAMTGAASLPLTMSEYFALPLPSAIMILLAGIVTSCALILRWPFARALVLVFLAAVLTLSAWIVFTRMSITVISWGILGSVFAVLLATLLLSRTIRTYESGR